MSRLCFILAAFLYAASSFAQTSRGTVTGLVVDPQAAAIAGANVDLTNRATNVVRSTSTNDVGLYRFDAVDLGQYDLSVKAAGFTSMVKRSFEVQANQVAQVDARLDIGETQTIVEVSSETVMLQTEAPVRGSNINAIPITELPYATRNPVSLALNLPGVSTNRFSNGTATFSVNGSRGRSNNFLMDGTENNDISIAGQAFQITNPDAVQEVSVQTSNYDAEFGRAAGAVINTITKSGTNSYHGTAAYTLDSTIDDAITNTQSLSPQIRERGHPPAGTEQWFSGTLGGRIIRDRTFFFGAYQEQRQNSQGTNSLVTPSANGRATLDRLYPKGTNPRVDIYQTVTRGADATASFFKTPLGDGRPDIEFGTTVSAFAQTVKARQYQIKVDHKLGEKDQLSVRYMKDDQDRPTGGTTNPFPGFITGEARKFDNALITETHVFSPVMTNETRLHFNRIDLSFPLNPPNPLGETLPRYDFGGGAISSLGIQTNLPQGRIANNYGIQDTFTLVRGAHSFRFGLDLLKQRSRQYAPITERGLLDYRDGGGFSYFANFLDDFGGAGPTGGSAVRDFGSPAYYPKLFRQAYFVQDRWRMSSAVALTLGLRYENFGVPINSLRTPAFTGLFNVDPVTFDGPYSKPNKVASDNNNFAPTVGLAWSPSYQHGPLGWLFGQKKGVFRVGYQIGYDTFFNNIASNAATSSPNLVSTQINSTVNAQNPRGLPNLSRALPLVPRPLTPLDSQTLVSGDLVNPYTQRWSAGIQRELAGNFLLDVSYVGSKGTRLFIQEDLNPLVPSSLSIRPSTSTPIPATRLVQRFDALQGGRTIRTNGGSSSYHSGQVLLTRRFAQGFFATAAYAWSKLLDNQSELFVYNSNPASSMIPSIFGGERLDRGFSIFDRTHRATFTWVYALPFLKQQPGILGRTIGGWELSGVTQFESGVPLPVLNGQDADGYAGSSGDRPDFNPNGRPGVRAVPRTTSPTGYVDPDNGNAPIDPSTARYIGLPAWTGSTPGRPGTLGRNTERTPGIKNWNLNVLKTVAVNERLRVQFRTEFFNLFNTPQYATPSVSSFSPQTQGLIANNLSSAPAGRFLQPQFVDGGGRVIRYQLKILF